MFFFPGSTRSAICCARRSEGSFACCRFLPTYTRSRSDTPVLVPAERVLSEERMWRTLWSKRSSRTSGVRGMILRDGLRLSDRPRLVMVEIRTGGNRSYKSLRRLNVDSRSWRRVKSTQARMNCLDSDGNGRYLNKKHVWPCS